MPPSRINTLPLDILRPILAYLDINTLMELFLTHNRDLQTLISSPNALNDLFIETELKVHVQKATYRWFLSSLRDVPRLRFASFVYWSPQSIPLLLALNPRELEVNAGFLHASVGRMLEDAALHPDNPKLRRLAQFFLPNRIPNFSVLTPRLESLMIASDAFIGLQSISRALGANEFRVPATLTKLQLSSSIALTSIRELPQLLSIDLSSKTVNLESLFACFSSLQELTIRDATLQISDSLAILPSLNSITYEGPLASSIALWSHPALKQSLVSSISIECSKSDNFSLDLNLASWFPTTLKSLLFLVTSPFEDAEADARDRCVFLRSLPSTLTSLSIDPRFLSPVEGGRIHILDSMVYLRDLTSLKHLQFVTTSWRTGPSFNLSVLGKMPPKLKSLHIHSTHVLRLTSDEIRKLPQTLTSLQVDSFDLELVEVFKTHLQSCRLRIANSTTPWEIPERALEATNCWLPHLDLYKLNSALVDYYATIWISLPLVSLLYKPIKSDPRLEPHLGLHSPDDEKQVQRFASRLKSVNLYPYDKMEPNFGTYPAGVTSITAPLATGQFSQWPFTSLTHLDSPRTSISFAHWPHLQRMTTIKAAIHGIDDFNVLPFVTSILSRKARFHSSISIYTNATGALLPDTTEFRMSDDDWSSISDRTHSILRGRLASPMPALEASPNESPQLDEYFVENDTIGRVIRFLSVVAYFKPGPSICLPPSATLASITLEKRLKWSVAPDWMMAPATPPNVLRLPPLKVDPPPPIVFPSEITRLELYNVLLGAAPLAFPETLLYLAITYKTRPLPDRSHPAIEIALPSSLQVLILWSLATTPSIHQPLKSLPSSLIHLALSNGRQLDGFTRPGGLSLQTIHFDQADLNWMKNTLPLHQLERCRVFSLKDFPLEDQLGDEYAGIDWSADCSVEDLVRHVSDWYARGTTFEP